MENTVTLPFLSLSFPFNSYEVYSWVVPHQVLELLAYFTYCTPAISPRLWSLWEPMAACLNEWAIDFFESVLVALDNYISRGTDHFLTCKQPDYLALANQVSAATPITSFLEPWSTPHQCGRPDLRFVFLRKNCISDRIEHPPTGLILISNSGRMEGCALPPSPRCVRVRVTDVLC